MSLVCFFISLFFREESTGLHIYGQRYRTLIRTQGKQNRRATRSKAFLGKRGGRGGGGGGAANQKNRHCKTLLIFFFLYFLQKSLPVVVFYFFMLALLLAVWSTLLSLVARPCYSRPVRITLRGE